MIFTTRRMAINPDTGALDITPVMATGDDAIALATRQALRLIMGEWFLDKTAGVPWIAQPDVTVRPILGVLPADLGYAEAIIKDTILSVPGVVSILSFAVDFDHNTRAASIRVEARTENGTNFTVSESVP